MIGYMYDADGIRVSKGAIQQWSCNPTMAQYATQTDYILGPGGEQMSEYAMQPNNTMAWVYTNVWAAGRLLATYAQDSSSTAQQGLLHFYFDDPLGTRRAQADYAGNLEQLCSSLPYGDGETCVPTPTEHLFTAKERDAESGNDYFGARYYASSMGRFLSPDWSAKIEPVPYSKLDDPQTLNLYAYVENNPLIRIDADGHKGGCSGDQASICKGIMDAMSKGMDSVNAITTAAKNYVKGDFGPLPPKSLAEHRAPPPPGVPAPPPIKYKKGTLPVDSDSALGHLMACTQSCENPVPLTATSTSEPVPGHSNIHGPDTPHGRGEAWDFTTPNGAADGKFGMVCSARCGAGFGLNEFSHPSAHATGGHDHAQTGPGLGGSRGDLPDGPQ